MPTVKKPLFPRHGCIFCQSTIHKRYNFNTHLDTHLEEVTNNSNNIAAIDFGSHFVPIIAAVRRRSIRHIEGIPALRRSKFDACHNWRLFKMLNNEHEMKAFKSRSLHSTSQWRDEANRFLLLRDQDSSPDSFVPFEHENARAVDGRAVDSDSEEHESDYEPNTVKSEPTTMKTEPTAVKSEHAAVKPEPSAVKFARPPPAVYTDSVHQSFGRSKGNKILFNNLAQANTGGSSSIAQASANRNAFTSGESSATGANRGAEAGLSRGYDFPALRTPRRAAPVEVIDLRTPEVKRELGMPTVLVLRGATGSVVVQAGTSLQDALALVSEKIGERVLHLRDSRGVVGEERWRDRPVGVEWKVAVEWAW